MLGAAAPRRALAAAVPRTGIAGLERLGLVLTGGSGAEDEVRATVDLRPVGVQDARGAATWWVASDQGASVTGAALAPDHVLGVGGASVTLAGLTVRDHRARALDLGTGSGIQALAAGRHCDAVVATDVSDRALSFARFNAALAGVDVDLRRGSLLEPVRGERFDLVVSNPPFVITPRGLVAGDRLPAYTYRDAGRAGDALVAELVAGLGEVLAPGGVARCWATGSTGRASAGPSAWGPGWTRPAWTAGWSSARCSTRRSTPSCGCATAARCALRTRPAGTPP